MWAEGMKGVLESGCQGRAWVGWGGVEGGRVGTGEVEREPSLHHPS